MPSQIDRDGVRRLAARGAQLVEVLPAGEYAEDHLPGAINLPLRKLERQATTVLGLLRAKELAGDPELRIAQAMRPGPSTFRPHVPIAEMARFMADHDLENSPVTTSGGRLVGLLVRHDATRVADELAKREGAAQETGPA